MIIDRLQKEALEKSPICVGLDTALSYLPKELKEKDWSLSEKVFHFNKQIIDHTEDLAACFKLQIAYYEAMGLQGLEAYKKTLAYLREKNILSIGDIKRGDILATQSEYAKAHLTGEFEADIVTVNAYMGEDAVSPFYPYLTEKEKGIFVLLHTSNESAGDLQELISGEKELYLHMGDLLEKWGRPYQGVSGFSAVGAVAGLTYPKEFEKLSELYPNMFFLIPGYGAQGGRGEDIRPVFQKRINGVVNSSRGIIAAHVGKTEGMDFASFAREAALVMKEESDRMAVILENRFLGDEMYLLRAQYEGNAEPGQFFMIRSAGSFPLLSRPLSIFDVQGDSISFLYKVIGEGTKEFSRLSQGMEIDFYGPFGKGFDLTPEGRNIALVGGGMGAAPLFYTAKRMRELNPDQEITLYLGFQKENAVVDVFKELNLPLILNFGGYVSEEVDYEKHDVLYTCGPEVMMRRVSSHGKEFGKPVFVSLEKHMACGVGACLGCTCKTKEGNKRVCKEGPVFPGEEVFYE